MHNVRTDALEETGKGAAGDPSVARIAVEMRGDWRTDDSLPQFAGTIAFPQGETTFEADFPRFLGGEGRAPSPLAYCFYGAMSCYGATFATQAAMEGVELRALRVRLRLSVDFRTALGVAEVPPLSGFAFEVEVETEAPDEAVQRVKRLADARCPAIWAMANPVPYETRATKA